MLRVVLLFLIFMAVLAMLGKWRPRVIAALRDVFRPASRKRLSARTCPACGAPRAGDGRCPCGRW
jgi:hypothetical protein